MVRAPPAACSTFGGSPRPRPPLIVGAEPITLGKGDLHESSTNRLRGSSRSGGFAVAAAVAVMAALPAVAAAHAPSGAIFTTLPDGSEVNFNHFDLKTDVYLDGGPGPGAPQEAAGLDDGTYVFQVTDPSGKVLLSTDEARCRQFTVSDGIITSIAPSDPTCDHVTGFDVDHRQR